VSIHRSLTSKSKLKRRRSVLSRSERIEKLEDEGRWNEGDTVFGLPATKVVKVRSKKKKKIEEAIEGAAAEGTPTEVTPAKG
jgi:small basic protein (TIGR04137 family)